MIREILDYILSRAPGWAHQRGLVYESIAIRSRYFRHQREWAPHLENCCAEISKFLSANPQAKRVIVFGSGHLLEFPKLRLQDPSCQYLLVDAVHPNSVRKYVKNLSHVSLLEVDLSQSADQVLQELRSYLDSESVLVSCNLLSQLHLSLASRTGGELQEQANRAVWEAHLSLLKKSGMPFLLVSDFARRFIGLDQELLHQESTLPALRLPRETRSWIWSLAPEGELSSLYSVELQVGVWTDADFARLQNRPRSRSPHEIPELYR